MLKKSTKIKSLIALTLVFAFIMQFMPKITIAFGGSEDDLTNGNVIDGFSNILNNTVEGINGSLLNGTKNADTQGNGTQIPVLRAVRGLLGASFDQPVLETENGNYIIVDDESDLRKIGTDEEVPGYEDLKWSFDAKYIVVSDIPLTDAWTPIMFNGEMYGIVPDRDDQGRDLATLLADYESLSADEKLAVRPIISNVTVVRNDPIDVSVSEGTGFFATISNKSYTDFAHIGVVGDRAVVRNIELRDVDVQNNTAEVSTEFSVLSTITSSIGTALGWVLDGLLKVLSFGSTSTDLQTTLSNLLNARAANPTIKATGAFAGRLIGDVLIEDCNVTGDVNVTSVNDRVGGFVGYTEGVTEYDGLSTALEGTANVLATLLNYVPYLGLGDLITILLGNDQVLAVGQLIPTDYKYPSINRCEVSGLTGVVGSESTEFIGGFIGHQIGTKINDCKVKDSEYELKAKSYGGGFCGNMRDAVIKGTLDDVGIDVAGAVLSIHPQSVTQRSSVENCRFSVTGGTMLGGFVGVQNSGVIVDDSVNCPGLDLEILATEDYAGGFSGYATVGWESSLGQTENHEKSLLGTVRQLATGLLSTDKSTGQRLLSLMGLAPSTILGSSVDCNSISVYADGNCAGGLLGKGDGVYVGRSEKDAFTNINNWDGEGLGIEDSPSNNPIIINNLNSVTAANYAGGLVGYDGSARFQGLLNNVVGLGDFIGFDVKDATIEGVPEGFKVTATERNAGGAFGLAMGGNITGVTVNNLLRVDAENRAAGFVGIAGPGELVGSQALTVNLLGLDRVVALQNLLAVGQGIEVKIDGCTVNGVENGFTVEAFGEGAEVYDYKAAGFIADSNSTKISNSDVNRLLSVIAPNQSGYAGGFIGTSITGGLAEVANDNKTEVKELINANGLLRAIGYLLPSYENCTVHFMKEQGYVEADIAGGFVADMESGTVDNQARGSGDYYAVYDIDAVKGQTFGGGFGGKVVSGGLATAGRGLSILGDDSLAKLLDVNSLAGVINAYVPYVKYAGVKSDSGFTVKANNVKQDDLISGAAGGFIGYASGAQISHSDVSKLKHTNVTPPAKPEYVLAPSYFDEEQSTYAVTGGRHAGGYIGNMDIGSGASVGEGLNVLNELSLGNIVHALNVVVSTVEHSKVEGNPGGFAVLATGTDQYGDVGKAGGFAGEISGGHVQDSHAINFSYVIGEEMAGGFVGNFKPGEVARLLDQLSATGGEESTFTQVLKNLADINDLASLIESFVPTIRNSTTTCIPCGGAVRADSASDEVVQRGCAGGYCGHNEGGQIWGLNTDDWLTEAYTGPTSLCMADRIHSVYGFEYAGGFTGYMEPASTASTGNISLLGGLLKLDNLLSALKVTYPTEENTAVYGPLRHLDIKTWNTWVKYIGRYGAYAFEFANAQEVTTEEELQEQINKYAYGTTVAAGREIDAKENPIEDQRLVVTEGGNAGGYVGYMVSGVITKGNAYDTKYVTAMRNAGGYVGKMQAGGLAEFGNVSLLGSDLLNYEGLQVDVGSLLKVADVFVPVIKNSSVEGFRSGMKVYSSSMDFLHLCGNAGGYAGSVYGGQIWGDADDENLGCNVKNLRYVQALNRAGGYAGLVSSASVAGVNTNSGAGLLQTILDVVAPSTNGDLASVLEATVATIRNAEVSAPEQHNEWGFVVEGIKWDYPRYAGGFVGYSEAATIGDRDGATKITVKDLRSVDGRFYAGGFVGLADIGGIADVATGDDSGETELLYGLVNAGNVTVLDVFRSSLYYCDVYGGEEGLCARAHSSDDMSMLFEKRYSGCAGGFGGGVMDSYIENSNVYNLNTVLGGNYVGGFVGHLGKSGAVDAGKLQVLEGFLGATAGVLDVFGSHIDTCTVSGMDQGYVVSSRVGDQQQCENISGGFAGFADLSKIKNSSASDAKLILSDEIAGGFVGKTDTAYLVDIGVDSVLLDYIILILDFLLKHVLYADMLEQINIIDLQNIPGFSDSGVAEYFDIHLLAQGDVLYLNLLGLRIGVSLEKNTGGEGNDTAIITIGDSFIEIPCSEDGGLQDPDREELRIALIKGNKTEVGNSTVTGIDVGYDVYGGGADYDNDGTGEKGMAGGFVGYNPGGEFAGNEMIYCDEVRGTAELVGHFSGVSEAKSVYSFNSLDNVEGDNNRYHVYRAVDYTTAETQDGTLIANAVVDTGTPVTYQRFDAVHRAEPIVDYIDWAGATMGNVMPIFVYVSSAKAVLMDGVKNADNGETMIPEPAQDNDPCKQQIDYTVQKIWDDYFNLAGLRPDSIKVILLVTEVLADGTVYKETTQYIDPAITDADGYIVMSKQEDGRFMSATWTHVIEGLPVAYAIDDFDEEGNPVEKLVYYRYSVDEVQVDGYTMFIQQGEGYERGMVSTITNTNHKIFPTTGSSGDRFILLALFLILVSYIVLRIIVNQNKVRKYRESIRTSRNR